METVELVLHGLTHGGEAVGRLPNGKACFVPFAIPGERVTVEVVEERKRWARARLVEVVEASPDRVKPPCPYFGPGQCGGCRLQHVAVDRQAAMLARVVTEQLERIGHLKDPPVTETVRPHGPDGLAYRNRARFAVDEDGRLAFRRFASHDLIGIDHCRLLTPATQQVRAEAGDDWGGAREVVVRTGTDGAGLMEIEPGPGGLPPLPEGDTAVAVIDALGKAVALRGDPSTRHDTPVGALEASANAFFQTSDAGAAALVELVQDAAAVRPGERALDLYAGVGLFSAALASDGAQVVAVERGRAAADDARSNLAELDVEVRQSEVDDVVAGWNSPVDVIVLDPTREGAGERLCGALTQLGARVIVYVACDPAALARDARALCGNGYRLDRAVPVDLFTHTAHVETVATFRPLIGDVG
ncbi:MAG: class I SAM-dependent RNA methyltransferase [Egibacteraceae bacterium]